MVNIDQFLAIDIASEADVENSEQYEDNISYYKNNNYTYIPIPSSNKFYHVTAEELRELEIDQYFHPDLPMIDAFDRLQKYPFLLYDQFMSFESTDEESDRRFEPTGLNMFEIDGSEMSAAEIAERSGALMEQVPEEHSDTTIIEAVVSMAEDRYRIVTLADANKRRARELFYHVISEFEIQLSNLIKLHYPDSFISDVKEDEIERWYRAKLDELEIHISEHMYLSTMLKVGRKTESIYEKFGFSSGNKFKENLGGLNDLRHKVMHPTRGLVHNYEDLRKQIERVQRAKDALEHLDTEQVQPEYPGEAGD